MPSQPGIGAGKDFDQRKSPTGGNAYGRDLVNVEYDGDDADVDNHDDDADVEDENDEEPEGGVWKAISASQHLTHHPPLGKNHFLVMTMIII